MKHILLFTLLLGLSAFYSYSHPLTLVKKDDWGSSLYIDVIKIGEHIYAVSSEGKLDILDPTKNLSKQLVGQVELHSNFADDLNDYNGLLSITLDDKVAFYNLDNPIIPALLFELNIDNAINSGQKITENQNHYIVEKNQLYVLNYTEPSEFEIIAVRTLDDLSSNDNSHSYQVNIDQGSLFIQQVEVTYSSNVEEKNYVVSEYDINDLNDIKLLSKATTPVELLSPHLAYLGRNHFALSTQDSVLIYKAESNEIVLVSELDIDANILGVYWQKDTNKLRVITSDYWHSYIVESFSDPILESKDSVKNKNKINKVYQFLSDNDAIVRTQIPNTIATVNLAEQDSLASLYDQSGSLESMAVSEDKIFVVKHANVHVVDILDDTLKYNNKLTGGDSVYFFRSVTAKEQTTFVDSNSKISVFESGDTTLPEFKFDVNVPTANFIHTSISDGANKVLKESSAPIIHWYNIETPLNILIPPLSLDLSTYEIEDNISIKYIREIRLVNGFLAISGTTVDRKMYLLMIKNNGQSLEVTDHLYVDSSNWANFFVGNKHLYQVIRYENKLTAFEVTNEGKLTEIQTVILSLSGENEEVFNGLLWENYLITQTDQHLQLYDFSTSELKPIDEIEISSTVSTSLKMNILNEKLMIGNYSKGTVSLFKFNFAPSFNISNAETDEDIQLTITDVASDKENDIIEYTIIAPPSNGELNISDDHLSITYIPNANYFGVDKFSLKATDIHGNFIEQEFEITVNSINDTPTLTTATVVTDEDSTLIFDVEAEAEDVDGDELTFKIVTNPEFGSVTISDGAQLTYQPNSDFFGDDTVEISVTDTAQTSAISEFFITVTPVNDIPVVNTTSFEMKEDEVLTSVISAKDVEDHHIIYSLVDGVMQNGVASIEADGSFIFTPTSNFNGEASFSVSATDSEQGSTEQIIFVDVEAVEDIPVTANETVAFTGSYSGSLIASDADGDVLTFTVVEGVKNGTLSLSLVGTYTYQANASFSGSDSFIYQVTDTKDNLAQATITFNVQAKPPEKETSSGGGSINYLLLFLAVVISYRKFKLLSFPKLTSK